MQDAFVQAFRKIGEFKGDSRRSERGSTGSRSNAALMKLRSKKSRPSSSIDDLLPAYKEDGHRILPEDPWQEPGDVVAERAETRSIVREAIDELPDDYRAVVLLRDVEQMDTREAADALGITAALVKTRLHRARQALRGVLERRFRMGAAS